jgi:putative endonuclease
MKAATPLTRVRPRLWPSFWKRLVRAASRAVLARQKLSPELLLGRQGEEEAYWYLRDQGLVMIERNYRPEGLRAEIDLIGWEGDVLVFVEVKTRRRADVRMPEAAVDREKQQNMSKAAYEYRRRANLVSQPFRFDIVSIVPANGKSLGDPRKEFELEHFRDAFRNQ